MDIAYFIAQGQRTVINPIKIILELNILIRAKNVKIYTFELALSESGDIFWSPATRWPNIYEIVAILLYVLAQFRMVTITLNRARLPLYWRGSHACWMVESTRCALTNT